MIKNVGKKNLFDAIKAVQEEEITYATFNKFEIRKEGSTVRIKQTSAHYTSFPADAIFICYLETFEKEDLKPGMLIRTLSGDIYLVLDNTCAVCEDEHLLLSNYNDDLSNKHNTNCDIIEIYKKNSEIEANLEDLMNLRFVDKIADIKH